MSVEKKTLDRIEKLLRLAAPDNGATEAERTNAALEAARLISAHELVVKEKRKQKPKAPPVSYPQYAGPMYPAQSYGSSSTPYGGYSPPAQYARRPPDPMQWGQSRAARDAFCIDCGGYIEFGDEVWIRMTGFQVEYLHRDGESRCGW